MVKNKISSFLIFLCCLIGLSPLRAAILTSTGKRLSNLSSKAYHRPLRCSAYGAYTAIAYHRRGIGPWTRYADYSAPFAIELGGNASHLASIRPQQRTDQSQSSWKRYRGYALGALGLGGLALSQYKRADEVEAAYYSTSPPKRVSESLLREDLDILKGDLYYANKDNIAVYFDFAEGIVADAERMIETARLSAMYLNDYVNEKRIASYKRIQDETLAVTKKLANKHGKGYPDFVRNFSREIKVKKSGSMYEIAISGLDPISQGVVDVFVELPGNVVNCCKLLLMDLPAGIVKVLDMGLGISSALGLAEPLEELVSEFKQNSNLFLEHYNTLSDREMPPIAGIALLNAASALQERLMMAGQRSMGSMSNPTPGYVVSTVADLYFNMDSYLGVSDKKNIENSDKLGDCSYSAYQYAINDVHEITKKLRKELGLVARYPDMNTRLEKWWGSKSDREKLRTIGRGIGEAILFFYAGDIFSEVLEGAGQIGSKLKNILRGSKAQKAIRITELAEEGGVSLQRASKLFRRGDTVRKVVVALEELSEVSKIANVGRHLKMMEIVVEGHKINSMRKAAQFTEMLTESLKGLEKATELCVKVVNKNGSVTKILSTGIKHGNQGHWTTMWNNALRIAESGKYSHVFLNKTFSTSAKFSKARIPSGFLKNRPDIWALGKNNKPNLLLEVISPSQARGAALRTLERKTKRVTRWLKQTAGLTVEQELLSIGGWCSMA